MSLIRIRAAEVFAAILAQHCPGLEGKICAGPADSNHKRRLPSVAIVPISFRFSPDQEEVWHDIGSTMAAINVGRYDALFQLQIGARNPKERAKIEADVMRIFFLREGAPGVLTADIGDCDNAIVSYELDQESWRDEAGFSDKWFSITTMNVVMPVLIQRGAYTMDEIRVCLRADTVATFSEVDQSAIECVAVDEAGNVTISTPPA